MRNFKSARFEHTKCIICDSDAPDLIYKGRGENDFEVNVCICKNCGFVYLNPRWDEATYFSFYQKTYDKYWRKYLSNIPAERDGSSYYPLYQRLLKTFPAFNPRNVLDVGCGNGKKLSYIMQRYPYAKYYALEPSAACKPEIEGRGITFIADDVNSEWDKNIENKFDFVVMRHTLEHFLIPEKVLAKVRKTMANDGILYIAVPDAGSVDVVSKVRLKTINFTVVHPYFFSEISLSNLLLKCGFSAIKVGDATASQTLELYMFANQSNGGVIALSSENYVRQKQVFLTKLKEESTLQHRLKVFVRRIVAIKKSAFPKPVFRRKHQLIEVG
jgi:SAM-dependent methyltransferase